MKNIVVAAICGATLLTGYAVVEVVTEQPKPTNNICWVENDGTGPDLATYPDGLENMDPFRCNSKVVEHFKPRTPDNRNSAYHGTFLIHNSEGVEIGTFNLKGECRKKRSITLKNGVRVNERVSFGGCYGKGILRVKGTDENISDPFEWKTNDEGQIIAKFDFDTRMAWNHEFVW